MSSQPKITGLPLPRGESPAELEQLQEEIFTSPELVEVLCDSLFDARDCYPRLTDEQEATVARALAKLEEHRPPPAQERSLLVAPGVDPSRFDSVLTSFRRRIAELLKVDARQLGAIVYRVDPFRRQVEPLAVIQAAGAEGAGAVDINLFGLLRAKSTANAGVLGMAIMEARVLFARFQESLSAFDTAIDHLLGRVAGVIVPFDEHGRAPRSPDETRVVLSVFSASEADFSTAIGSDVGAFEQSLARVLYAADEDGETCRD